MPILSFHRVFRECAAGQDEGWREFLCHFSPLSEHLAGHYFPDVWPEPTAGAVALFSRLRANGAERLRGFAGQAEKEFLLFLRDELFALGRVGRASLAPPAMTHEQFAQLLEGFLPIPRAAVVMLAKGYPPEKFAVVLHMEDSTAGSIGASANEKLQAMGVGVRLPCNLDALLAQLEQSPTTPECVAVLTFVRMIDGQITWRDKEAADQHMAGCLHCLQKFVTYQELHWFYLDHPSAAPERVASVAAKMGLAARPPGKGRTIFQRIFRASSGRDAPV